MPIRHPSEDAEEADGYLSLIIRGKSEAGENTICVNIMRL
jgi:hypothetical protein